MLPVRITVQMGRKAVPVEEVQNHKVVGALDLEPLGSAEDGRTACMEARLRHAGAAPTPALIAATRGDSGLVSELRLY